MRHGKHTVVQGNESHLVEAVRQSVEDLGKPEELRSTCQRGSDGNRVRSTDLHRFLYVATSSFDVYDTHTESVNCGHVDTYGEDNQPDLFCVNVCL